MKNLRTSFAVLAATFISAPLFAAPNDVIINEFFYNDTGATVYPAIGAGIAGDWIELLVVAGPVDMRNWVVTDHNAPAAATEGTLTLPNIAALSAVPTGTLIVLVPDTGNLALAEDLDHTDGKLILKASGDGGSLVNVGFAVANGDDNIVLLNGSFADYPPGGLATTAAVDFTAEGVVTSAANWGLTFSNPFSGIGTGDGCGFTNDGSAGWNNDNGAVGWLIDYQAASATPGLANTGQNLPGATNQVPVVTAGAVSPLQPTPSTPVVFSVTATDDGTLSQVRVLTSSSPTGPFTPAAMSLVSGDNYTLDIGTQSHGTVLYFYFEAEDSLGAIGAFGGLSDLSRVYSSANRASAGEVVINEIAAKSGFSGAPDIDWIELHNTALAARDLSFMGLSDDQPASGGRPFELPLGTSIPASGFVIVTGDVAAFEGYAPWLASAGSSARIGDVSFGFSSAGDTVSLTDDIGAAYDQVIYDASAPWDVSLTTDASAELIDPLSDNSLSSNWSSTTPGNVTGSPGAVNFANSASNVTEWIMY